MKPNILFILLCIYTVTINAQTRKWVDLGLPSGTLWAAEPENGEYTCDEAIHKFSNHIPTKEQWEELIEYCNYEEIPLSYSGKEIKGYVFIGSNGNRIYLYASGLYNGVGIGLMGIYLSRTKFDNQTFWCMFFSSIRAYLSS